MCSAQRGRKRRGRKETRKEEKREVENNAKGKGRK